MSTHKNIDRVCIIVLVMAILATVLFMNGSVFGIKADTSKAMDYENTIFDDSYVHSIDIEISDWDAFLETAASEEYTSVNVTIDGEKLKNVALRAKGNTSLSTVSQLGSNRYSLKLEFDRFQNNITYHGLDKLCLNNLIQDYTMMKDYIAYKLMNEFGVTSPLVSYVYVTVNGEDWGLFLAVEAVEDAFLERNYGVGYGDLYKPDSMSMGGGRGNGRDFDMKDMDFDEMGMKNPFEKDEDSEESESEESQSGEDFPGGGPGGGFPGGGFGGFGMGSSDVKLQYTDDDVDSYSTIFNNAKTVVSPSDQKRLISALKSLNEGVSNGDAEEIASAVDIDAVLRYMVVHNFVANNDSYTGNMIHNYYLYEDEGKLSMIPWDYNLAYGTFQASDASSAVNDPIDTPLSVTEGSTDRPMFSWITSCDEYTQMYHEYFEEFLSQFYDSGYLTNLIDTTAAMISEYVEKDPTKFCEYSEFEKAVSTIREFVTLRCQSIEGQLNGTIGSTDSAQSADPDALIDASSINLSDMGSMGGGGGPRSGGGSDKGGGFANGGPGSHSSGNSSDKKDRSSSHHRSSSKDSSSEGKSSKDSDSTNNAEAIPEGDDNSSAPGNFSGFANGGPGGNMPGDFSGFGGPTASVDPGNYIYLGGCILILLAAIIFTKLYRTRK